MAGSETSGQVSGEVTKRQREHKARQAEGPRGVNVALGFWQSTSLLLLEVINKRRREKTGNPACQKNFKSCQSFEAQNVFLCDSPTIGDLC